MIVLMAVLLWLNQPLTSTLTVTRGSKDGILISIVKKDQLNLQIIFFMQLQYFFEHEFKFKESMKCTTQISLCCP